LKTALISSVSDGILCARIGREPVAADFIKSKLRRAKRARVAESSRQIGSRNPVEVVLRVKDLAREVGGIKNLKMLVDLLAE